MLDIIATETVLGKPSFFGQAPAEVSIDADQMGQGIAKPSLGSYKHQPLGWKMGMWLQGPFHIFTPEKARRGK